MESSYETADYDLNWSLEDVNPVGIYAKGRSDRAYETISEDGRISLAIPAISMDAILQYVKD